MSLHGRVDHPHVPAMSENATVDHENITGLKQEVELLELLETVATAANQAPRIEDAMQVALDRVCAHTGWPVGHVYAYEKERHRLESAGVWHVGDGGRYEEFRRASERMTFEVGVGLPGRVLES